MPAMTAAGGQTGPPQPEPSGLPAAPQINMQEYGRPSTPRSGTNGFAIAALACGLLGGLLGVVFGIIALNQISNTGQRGRGLAIGGLIAFGAWFVAVPAIGVTVALLSHGPSAPVAAVATETSSPPPLQLRSLQAGECFDYTLDSAHLVRQVQRLPCTQPHTSQILGSFDLAGSVWPGEEAIRGEASTRCRGMVAKNTHLPTGMYVSFAYPGSAGAWNAGLHQVTCYLNMPSGKTTSDAVDVSTSPTP